MITNRRLVFAALIAAGVLWGTTVPLSKLALGWLPPAWLAFARFALAAAVLMAASRSRLRSAFSPAIVVSGGIGYGGSVLLQNLGIDRTSVTHAALLIGATPVLVAVGAAVLGHSVARPLAWAGFALSLVGVGVIAGGQSAGSSLGGDGLILASQLASAGFTVSQARLLRGRDPVAVTGLQLMAAAAAMLPVAVLTEHHTAGPASGTTLLAVVGLVLAGTVGPTALFAFGQSRVSADVAGAFLNIEPLVGAILGVLIFATPVGLTQIAGGSAIVAGIALSSLRVGGRLPTRRPRTCSAAVPSAPGGPALGGPLDSGMLSGPDPAGIPAPMRPALAGYDAPGGFDRIVLASGGQGVVLVSAGRRRLAGTAGSAQRRGPGRASGRPGRGGPSTRPPASAAWRRSRRLRDLADWASRTGRRPMPRPASGPRSSRPGRRQPGRLRRAWRVDG